MPQDNEAKYAADLARFESAVARVNDIKPDLVLITGDMTHKAEDLGGFLNAECVHSNIFGREL